MGVGLVGVVSRRWVWLVVWRYIDILTIFINFPHSICISSFLASASLLLRPFFKCFFGLVIESVDSISRDEQGFPLTQYITNG